MKKIKFLALSMAFVLGASMVTGNFVSASGTPNKAEAEMKSAMSVKDARYPKLRQLIENIKKWQEHYRFVRNVVKGKGQDVSIPGFSKEKEREYAKDMVSCSKTLVDLATSSGRAGGVVPCECLDFFEEITAEYANARHMMESNGYAPCDYDSAYDLAVGIHDYDMDIPKFFKVESFEEVLVRVKDERLDYLNEHIDTMLEMANKLLKIVEESSAE